MEYPDATRLDLVDHLHGHAVADPYRWLEDADDPATVAWSAAQDDLWRRAVAGYEPARTRFATRIAELLRSGSVGAPAWRQGRAFFTRREPDQEHAVLLVREPDGTERVLVDPIAVDPAGTTTLDAWQPSKEGALLAYQLSHGGTEESLLRVLDVTTGETVDGPVDRTRYSPVAWLPGGEAYYYVRRLAADGVPAGEEQLHRRVYLHRLGPSHDDDTEVWGDGLDKTNYYGVSVSMDGRWLVVSASAGTAPRDDVWLGDLRGDGTLRPVQVGVDAQTSMHVGLDGRLYVATDRDAPRGRLCVADPERPGHEHWRDLVPERPDAVLDGYAVTDDVLVVAHTQHALSRLAVHDRVTGEHRYDVTLPGPGSLSGPVADPLGGSDVWFGWTDFLAPARVHRLDTTNGAVDLWAASPGHVDVPDLHARQVFYASADGTRVPMFVLTPEGAPERPRPTILYGYGGFNVPMTPGYSAGIAAWVEAGGAYAIACLRGGSEEGEEWHRAGMRERKQNVFDDLHAAAEWLRANGYASTIGISGGSNGGLLVGAALTQRPDLYDAVACSAPLLDMVRYERFGLGTTWNDEYGTADDPVELGWLLGYSPYHHVREGTAYPAVLFTVFDSDTRVDPLHARKMCAALQHATTSERPVLLRRERDVGHGARSVSRSVDLAADTTAFLATHLGLETT
ncbi:MAG TPA: prolyl oligopeptidase family serine peptidase [Mycobacteriales bacterium]|jgi:prolyl oligopeptidase|nr:prolyl oligopeptidase family serine peptidase [Mycobacteriales bacterium]